MKAKTPVAPADDTQASQVQEPPDEAVAAILRAVDSLEWPIGRIKLGRLLKGRISQEMVAQGYADNPYRGSLAGYTLAEIDGFIRALIDGRLLLATRGMRPFLRITLEGAGALLSRAS